MGLSSHMKLPLDQRRLLGKGAGHHAQVLPESSGRRRVDLTIN